MRNLLFVAGLGLLIPYWVPQPQAFLLPGAFAGLLLCYWRRWRWVGVLVVAIGYSHVQVQDQAQNQLQGCQQKLRTAVRLQVVEVGAAQQGITRFVGLVQGIEPPVPVDSSWSAQPQPPSKALAPPSCQLQIGHRVRLSWRDAPDLALGSRWEVEVVASEPWGYRNPGGFNYERWLLGANLAATGYVRQGVPLDAAGSRGLLQQARSRVAELLAAYPQGKALQALVLGDAGQLHTDDWQRLRLSGTLHLFVVSGLHVGLVASGIFAFAKRVVCLLPWLVARIPAQQFGLTAALLGSGGYLWLTGAQVPGVRAWLMLSFGLLWLGRGRRLDLWLAYGVAWILVLLLLPGSGWQQGFYLSFGAVLTLLLLLQPRLAGNLSAADSAPAQASRRIARWLGKGFCGLLRIQLALLVAMLPLSVLLGLATPTLGLLLNLAAVPWVSLVIVPLALLGSLCSLLYEPLGHQLLVGANLGLAWFERLLDLGALGGLWLPPKLGWWQQSLLSLAGLLLLVPLGWRLRLLLLGASLSLLAAAPSNIPIGHFRLLILDVGQGSSILVSTNGHHLLFDSGPAYASGFAAATAMVAPSLAALHLRRLDGLILSHEDLDHAGGADHIRRLLQPKLNLQGGLVPPAELPKQVAPCQAGQQWVWDQVRFELLNPEHPLGRKTSSNDASCVLRVSSKPGDGSPSQQALLFGDVSKATEMVLLKVLSNPAAIVMAPHHGSATSSSRALVRRLRPALAVASAARHSRYGHPHPDVVARYCAAGARFFVTGEAGAITWRSDKPAAIALARQRATPWRLGSSLGELNRCRQAVQPLDGPL